MSEKKEKGKMPAIRFKGFGLVWKEVLLSHVTDIYDGTHQTPRYINEGVMFLSVENIQSLTSEKFISKEDFEKDFKVYPMKNDVLMTRIGDVGTANVVTTNNPIAYYVTLALLKYKGVNPYFLKNSLSSDSVKKEIWHRTLHIAFPKKINMNEIAKVVLNVPKNQKEQTKIGKLFQQLDTLINQHQQKHEKLRCVKKALLTKMFPKQGETQPAIRFKGFSAAWEVKALGECFDERVERSAEGQLISITINSGIKLFSELGRHDNSSDDKSKYKRVKIGDISYNSMRMWQGSSGYSPYEGILSPAYTVIKPKNNISSIFFSYMIKKPEMILTFQNRSQGITSDTWNLKFPAFSKIFIQHPQKEEQTKIGNLFQQLDTLINQHQTQINKLNQIKQAMLAKMFV